MMENIPAGAIFTVTTGCYSDYSVRGVFRATKDIDANKLREGWLLAHPEQQEQYSFEVSEFLAWVSTLGFMEPVESWEWHLGDYGNASEMDIGKA